MGIITALPITTTSIPELPVYGSVNEDAAKKDLIEITKNTGTSGSPVYDSGGSRKIPLDEFKLLAGGKPRFFEKYEKWDLVISSLNGVDYYHNFTITPAMQGYYLQMHLNGSDGNNNQALIWGQNIAFKFNFTGTFPDGFCIRIQPLTLGGSKCNLFDYYLTSGKAYDFVYDLELDHWAVDELQNVCHKSSTYLPLYGGSSGDLFLTNSNHTYIFKIGDFAYPNKIFFLPKTSLWRGRKITIFIDRDVPNDKLFGPLFYPTPYALATGLNAYSAAFTPVVTAYKDKIIWVKFPADSTGLVTIDAGFGAKKAYIVGVQLGSGDIISTNIYQFHYDVDLDSANGGWVLDNATVPQPDTIEGELFWRFPFGTSGVKRGSYVVFESEGYGSIKISDMNIII